MKKIILILIIFLLTGCYDYNELNDLEIISSIIVDYKDNEYKVHLEVVNTNENGEHGSYFLSGSGKNLESALNNVYFQSAQTPFYSKLNAFIISDSLAEKGIEDFFDYLMREPNFRKDFFFFICDDVDELLNYETEKNSSIGDLALNNAKQNHEKNGLYKTNSMREIAYHYLRKNSYVIGDISIKDDMVTLDKSYLFTDGKKDIEIDESAALFSNIVDGTNISFQVFTEDSYDVHEYKLKSDVKENKISLKLTGHGRLTNSSDNKELDSKSIKETEKNLNAKIEKLFKEIINYSIDLDKDIFHFDKAYFKHFPKEVDAETWKNLEYEITSDITINEKGLLTRSIGGPANGK